MQHSFGIHKYPLSCYFPTRLQIVPISKKARFVSNAGGLSGFNKGNDAHVRDHDSALPDLVSLDVEYIHFKTSDDDPLIVPGEVCIVKSNGDVLYHTYCRPGWGLPTASSCAHRLEVSNGNGKRICACAEPKDHVWIGGVPERHWRGAPLLVKVTARTSAAIYSKLLIGHGLQNDLRALGVSHPKHLTRDTMAVPLFQTRRGHARTLKALAAQFLNMQIQTRRHSAR